MSKPTLYYFPIRGRGEAIRALLAYNNIDWIEGGIDGYKTDLDKFPFFQMPVFVDGDTTVSQTNAILRYIARQHDNYGSSVADGAQIDAILYGIHDIRAKYLPLVYTDELAPAAKDAYWAKHIDPTTVGDGNGGTHWGFISNAVKKSGAGAPGKRLTIADIEVFDLFDNHVRIFGDKLREAYPDLVALHARVGGEPAIKAYRNSERLHKDVNGNGLGN